MDVAYDDLNDEEKQYLLEQLWEENQRDPDNFPEDQRMLLEQEIHKFIDPNQFDDDMEDDMDDDRMKIEGNINFPKEPLPMRKGDDDDTSPQLEIDDGPIDKGDDDDKYMKELMEQQEKDKQDRLAKEQEMMQPKQETDQDDEPQQPDNLDQDEMDIQDDGSPQDQDQYEDEDE